MKQKKLTAMYFSGTGTTQKVVTSLATKLSESLSLPLSFIDFSLPEARQNTYTFNDTDLVICGLPVYAGRVPNLLLPFITEHIKGSNALLIPIVTFGNRNYDDALAELSGVLAQNGLIPIAAGAFSCEHSFSATLGANRPDTQDMAGLSSFAKQICKKILSTEDFSNKIIYQNDLLEDIFLIDSNNELQNSHNPLIIKGSFPPNPYYTPRDRNGTPINILKVKPKTNELCTGCGLCAEVCTMGSISKENPKEIIGICTKCCACVKKCPVGAKYYDDAGYLYHKSELEEMYARRASNHFFI